MVPTDPRSLAEKYTCDSSSKAHECSYLTSVTMEEFPDDCDDVSITNGLK